MIKQKRCAIYTRKSVEDGLEQEFNSLDAQRSCCQNYIDLQEYDGWICLPKHYDDGGWSGGNTDRPAFMQLLEDIEAKLIDIVVVYKVDRLSRSMIDFIKINNYFDQHNVTLVSVTQAIDRNSASGNLHWHSLVSYAQYEREIISERVRDKIAESRRMGKYYGGMTPYGYKRNEQTRRLDIDLSEARVVRWIFKNYLKMRSCGLVAATLNMRGKKTRRWVSVRNIPHGGKIWNLLAIHKIITNPIYIGIIQHHEEKYPGEHQPIISQDIWDQAQDILAQNRHSHGTYSKLRQFAIFTTLVKCGECDCALTPTYTDKNRKRYFYYVCQKAMKYPDHICNLKKISAGEMEKLICHQLAFILQSYSLRTAIIRELETGQREYCKKFVKERSALRQMLKYVKDEDTRQEQEKRIAEINSCLINCQKKIRQSKIDHDIDQFYPIWNLMSPQSKTEFLDSLIEEIRIYPTKVQLFLSKEFYSLKEEISSRLRKERSLSFVSFENERLLFESPISQHRVNGQNHLEMAGINYNDNRRCLLHAIAISWKWNELLCSGSLKNISDLARYVKFSEPYVHRVLALSNLAPSIVEDIVNGNIPDALSLARLHEGFPDDWNEQRKKLGFIIENS